MLLLFIGSELLPWDQNTYLIVQQILTDFVVLLNYRIVQGVHVGQQVRKELHIGQCCSMHFYSVVDPTVFNRAYAQKSVHRLQPGWPSMQ